jgi:predicted RND superfamily exporter protein
LASQIDVGGFMYFWGLTIDIVAATNIIISVGLCVDFAAHLTHAFMKQRSDFLKINNLFI